MSHVGDKSAGEALADRVTCTLESRLLVLEGYEISSGTETISHNSIR
jgi:hypothetical protein